MQILELEKILQIQLPVGIVYVWYKMMIPTSSDIEIHPCTLHRRLRYFVRLFCTLMLIPTMDTKAKSRHLEKFTSKETLRQVFEAPSPPRLLFGGGGGGSSNFVGSEYGQSDTE